MTSSSATLIGGRYQLGELLGRGGMAEVRKGLDTRLGRAVAIKRLRTDLASDPTFQARFRREAQSAASLNHPSIVAVYDTGEEPTTDGSGVAQPYIVMEYVAGRTLREVLREGRKILPERALEITAGVLSALDYSHRAGIIHRDIKPGNVMLTPGGDVKVMDFGIARAISDASSAMTQTAAVVGTAQYLSPEQARGETVDARSDVYSTGCMLYELLTGRPPFMGDSPVSVAYQHVREQAAPPSDHDTDLPAQVDAVTMNALAKRVEDRYQSAAAMRGDIERYLAGRPVQAPPVPIGDPADAITGPGATLTGGTRADLPETPDRRRGWWIAAGVLLLTLAAVTVFAAVNVFGGDPPPKTPETIQVEVPNLTGLAIERARAVIREQGLTVGTETGETSETAPEGEVISQDPEPTTEVDEDTAIDLVYSEGRPEVTVPSVIGDRKNQAARELRAAKLEPDLREQASDEPAGVVIETNPAAAETVVEGSSVIVYYSAGPADVPNVVGISVEEATAMIEAAGFDPRVVEIDDPTDEEPGLVVRQDPEPGTEKPAGSIVIITVSIYEEPTDDPSEPTDSLSPSVSDSPQPEFRSRENRSLWRAEARAVRRIPPG
jgi:eukaryotic-like serine/threonine-protein kinase